MADINKAPAIRASGLNNIMTDPRSSKDKELGALSETAKSYCVKLAKETYYGVEFPLDNKYLDKGKECENEAIELLSKYLKQPLSKHVGREYKDGLTGECDLLLKQDRCGFDTKVAWSLETFPCFPFEIEKKSYEWQMRAYMALYDCDKFTVAYCLIDTPEGLRTYLKPEELKLHMGFDMAPLKDRITLLTYERDLKKEALMFERIAKAREYIAELIEQLENKE